MMYKRIALAVFVLIFAFLTFYVTPSSWAVVIQSPKLLLSPPLFATLSSGGSILMARAASSGSAGNGSSYDDTIDYAAIDNAQHSYYLYCSLLSYRLSLYGVIIEYTFTEPY